MELKINQLTETNKKIFNEKNSKSLKHSFKETLKTAEAFSSSFDPIGNLSDKGLKAVEKLEKIFDIKITNADFKNDGYLNIMKILRHKGDKVSPKEVNELKETLIMGVNSDLISLKDAYEVLNWLKARILSFKIKDDEMKEIINIIDKQKETMNFSRNKK